MRCSRFNIAVVTLIATVGAAGICRAADSSGKSAAKAELPPKEAAKACLATADEMVRSGYTREAAALYERARQVDPSQQQVCRYLAVLYDEIGADSQALAEYNHAVRLTPKDSDLLNDFGYFTINDMTWD